MATKIFKKNLEYAQVDPVREKYSDFMNSFLVHPNTQQLVRKTNIDAVKMAIRNLILTNKYERLRNPGFGVGIRSFLFENFSPETKNNIEETIKDQIEQYEPRAKVESVDIQEFIEQNALNISVVFYVIMSDSPGRLDVTLYKVR